MPDDNLGLENLRLVRSQLRDMRNDMTLGFSEVRSRLWSIEGQMAGIRGDLVGFNSRQDQLQDRVERIEQRLDLRDT